MSLETPAEQWAYGWVVRPSETPFEGRLCIEIEADVKKGVVGFGVLQKDETVFYHEVHLCSREGKQRIRLFTPEHRDIGSLVVRNRGDQGVSEVVFQILSVEPARLDHELYLIYQPGKVASQTIEAQLLRVFPPGFVERHHFLSASALGFAVRHRETLVNDATAPYFEGEDGVARQVGSALKARARISGIGRDKVLIITGIRDPVEYCVSAFFQNLDVYCPWITYDEKATADEAASVLNYFNRIVREQALNIPPSSALDSIARQKVSHPGMWFAGEFKEFTGIDIRNASMGSAPFVQFRANGFDVFLYRFEALASALPMLMQTVAGAGTLAPPAFNVGSEKKYGPIYEEFKRRFAVTAYTRYLLLQNEYTRRFYPDLLASKSLHEGAVNWIAYLGIRIFGAVFRVITLVKARAYNRK